jgi:hypothetical protein
MKLLVNGVVYLCGRDIKYRPIMRINLSKLPTDKSPEENLKDFSNALKFVMIIGQTYGFSLGTIENFLFVIDANKF